MLFFAGDERVKPYFEEIDKGLAVGILSCVNLAELYYKMCEKLGKDVAEVRCRRIIASKMRIVPLDEEAALKVGLSKCRHRRLSLADCAALTLAETENATLLTTDRELAGVRRTKVKLFHV